MIGEGDGNNNLEPNQVQTEWWKVLFACFLHAFTCIFVEQKLRTKMWATGPGAVSRKNISPKWDFSDVPIENEICIA